MRQRELPSFRDRDSAHVVLSSRHSLENISGVRPVTSRETHFRRDSKSSHGFPATRPGTHAQEARELVARARDHQHSGSVAEACVAFEMAVALIDGAPTSPLHADLHRWHGALLFDIGSTSEAEALFRRSLETAQFIRYAIGIARAQASLARVAFRRGDLAAAKRQYDDASLNAVASGDHALFARVELDLGMLSALVGDIDDATQRFRLSMRALSEAGDDSGVAWALDNIAQLRLQRGRLDEARGAVPRASRSPINWVTPSSNSVCPRPRQKSHLLPATSMSVTRRADARSVLPRAVVTESVEHRVFDLEHVSKRDAARPIRQSHPSRAHAPWPLRARICFSALACSSSMATCSPRGAKRHVRKRPGSKPTPRTHDSECR